MREPGTGGGLGGGAFTEALAALPARELHFETSASSLWLSHFAMHQIYALKEGCIAAQHLS